LIVSPIATLVTARPDHERIAQTLALAFQNEEACSYIFPDSDDRARRLVKMFRVIVANDAMTGRLYQSEHCEAATLWRAPGNPAGNWLDFVRSLLPFIAALGGNIGRALKVSGAIEKHHPQLDFWYLHFAGCAPEHQGKGFGGAAIRAGLAHADAAHQPCYLETATEGNLALYRNLGFEVTAQWSVSSDLHFWGMLRPAR
jgi:ribosomal protein S18 acetylase RimI-like enzyme